jgi:sensor c-di-GMP phosphodiesterase-like protein
VIPAGTVVYLIAAAFATSRLGVLGIALSEVLVEIVVFVVLTLAFAAQNARFSRRHIALKLFKYTVVAAATMYFAAFVVGSWLTEPLLRLPASLLLGAVLYAAALLLVRDRELKSLLERLWQAVKANPRPAREIAD